MGADATRIGVSAIAQLLLVAASSSAVIDRRYGTDRRVRHPAVPRRRTSRSNFKVADLVGAAEAEHFNDFAETVRQSHEDR